MYLLYIYLLLVVLCIFGFLVEIIKGIGFGILYKYEIRFWSCFQVGRVWGKNKVLFQNKDFLILQVMIEE